MKMHKVSQNGGFTPLSVFKHSATFLQRLKLIVEVLLCKGSMLGSVICF